MIPNNIFEGEEEEGEVYEVLNIRSLKQATPNLTVINIWGVSFVEDAHIEAFSSNCIQLAVLCVGYCPKVSKMIYFWLRQELKVSLCLCVYPAIRHKVVWST